MVTLRALALLTCVIGCLPSFSAGQTFDAFGVGATLVATTSLTPSVRRDNRLVARPRTMARTTIQNQQYTSNGYLGLSPVTTLR
jgi:hypothetical protein